MKYLPSPQTIIIKEAKLLQFLSTKVILFMYVLHSREKSHFSDSSVKQVH